MSWDCNEDKPETTKERIDRLNAEIKKEQEVADNQKADDMEHKLSNLRSKNSKYEIDDRF